MRVWIKLARPVIQTAWFEVDAGTEEAAVAAAVEQARRLPETGWTGAFDEQDYSYDVQEVEAGDAPLAFERDSDYRYLLLRASVELGEGQLLPQPWLDRESGLFVADVSGDWLESMEELHRTGMKDFSGWLREQKANVRAATGPTVVPFLPYLLKRQMRDWGETNDPST